CACVEVGLRHLSLEIGILVGTVDYGGFESSSEEWELEAILKDQLNCRLNSVAELFYKIPGKNLAQGIRKIANDRDINVMVASLGKNNWTVVYIVHSVEEYTGEVDINLREGARNEPPNDDNATTSEAGPSNANVEDTNQDNNEAKHDENEGIDKDDGASDDNEDNGASDSHDDEHDDEGADEGLGDANEATEEAKIDDKEGLVDVNVGTTQERPQQSNTGALHESGQIPSMITTNLLQAFTPTQDYTAGYSPTLAKGTPNEYMSRVKNRGSICDILELKRFSSVLFNSVNVTVDIEGATTIANTDRSFVCVTLDWWPAEKCNYGMCPWHQSSVLNLVVATQQEEMKRQQEAQATSMIQTFADMLSEVTGRPVSPSFVDRFKARTKLPEEAASVLDHEEASTFYTSTFLSLLSS
ncbi:uncharacterized protein A4U43_C02F12780, partial [Asparagus officinalis]